jgi:hypothetical protein
MGDYMRMFQNAIIKGGVMCKDRLKDEYAVREYLVSILEGLLGVTSDAWFEFNTIDLVKLFIHIKYLSTQNAIRHS